MICRNCGAKLNDGARFCAKCGQRVENVAQGTGMNTPPNMYYGQPVNNGNYNQNEPKKKHSALIAVAIVLAGILLLSGIVFISVISSVVLSYGDDKDAGQSEGVALQEDPYYDDVVRCMQGDWYVWEKDGTWWHFIIDGTSFSEYKRYSAVNILTGTDYTQFDGDIETTDRKGELKIVDNNSVVETLYYKYDENTDSVELTCDGYILERNDVYGRIKDLIQGDWNDFNSIEEGGTGHYFTFKGTEFTLLGSTGNIEITPDGRLILSASHNDTVFTIYYEYDENADSIVLTYEGNVLEKQ